MCSSHIFWQWNSFIHSSKDGIRKVFDFDSHTFEINQFQVNELVEILYQREREREEERQREREGWKGSLIKSGGEEGRHFLKR